MGHELTGKISQADNIEIKSLQRNCLPQGGKWKQIMQYAPLDSQSWGDAPQGIGSMGGLGGPTGKNPSGVQKIHEVASFRQQGAVVEGLRCRQCLLQIQPWRVGQRAVCWRKCQMCCLEHFHLKMFWGTVRPRILFLKNLCDPTDKICAGLVWEARVPVVLHTHLWFGVYCNVVAHLSIPLDIMVKIELG